MKQYLVLDIGGTFIKYALMGEDGSFLESGKVPSPMDSLESLLDAVAAVAVEAAEAFPYLMEFLFQMISQTESLPYPINGRKKVIL